MAASTTLHEPAEHLTVRTVDIHRAVVSLIEELEAVDWYNQRAEAAKDPQLQAVLKHNRDEEIEHASMTLEWIRRNISKFDEALKLYLFTKGEITAIEETTKEKEGKKDEMVKPERGPYGLALAPELYNSLFRRYAGSDLLQIEHLKRLCTRGIVKAAIDGCVLVARDVGSIVLGQDLQVSYLTSDAAHEHFAVSESLVLKIEAPDAICTITSESKRPSRQRR
jgi:ferritin-like protein